MNWWWLKYKDCYWRDISPETRRQIIAESAPNPLHAGPDSLAKVGRRISRCCLQNNMADLVSLEPPVIDDMSAALATAEQQIDRLTGTIEAMRQDAIAQARIVSQRIAHQKRSKRDSF